MCAGTATPSDPAPAEPSAPAPADQRALIDEQMAVLRRVAEVGLALTLQIERQAGGEGPEGQAPAALGDLALAYSRTSRALRLTVMLQSKLARDRKAIDDMTEIRARTAASFDAVRRAHDPLYAHKDRVERIVERVAREAVGEDEGALERLMVEACERLDDEDLYGKVLQRPIGELVALICRDLGLNPDWARLSQEAWARAEIESGAKGSPFLAGTCSAEGRTCPQTGIAPDIEDTHLRSMSPETAIGLGWFDGPAPAFADTG